MRVPGSNPGGTTFLFPFLFSTSLLFSFYSLFIPFFLSYLSFLYFSYKKAAENVATQTDKLLPSLKALDFKGNDYNENRLKWTFVNIAVFCGLLISDEAMCKSFGSYPKLSNGSRGFVYGYDNDYANHHFNGIYGDCSNKAETASFSVAISYFCESKAMIEASIFSRLAEITASVKFSSIST